MIIKENVHTYNNVKPIVNGKAKENYVPPKCPSMENTSNTVPLFGSQFKDDAKVVVIGSTPLNLLKKHNEKKAVTPIKFGALKIAKGSMFQTLLRTRSEVKDAEDDELQTKSSRYPLPNNKKRKCSSKGSFKKYVIPRDFLEQQNAYFKEIDEYELVVKEVE